VRAADARDNWAVQRTKERDHKRPCGMPSALEIPSENRGHPAPDVPPRKAARSNERAAANSRSSLSYLTLALCASAPAFSGAPAFFPAAAMAEGSAKAITASALGL
jgi:hypothetical protein